MEKQVIMLERKFNAPIAKVWNAITDKNEMKNWYFDLEDFKAEPGFKFQFTGGPSPDKQYVHLCEVTEVIPGQKLTYSWRYEGYAGNSFVTFELVEQGLTTLLKLTHEGLETFPANNPDFMRKNFEEGWDQIVNVSLKGYLEPEKNKAGQ
ncbi:MAG: SRPBCC domain-containing protein [Ferruginibacter sp.]